MEPKLFINLILIMSAWTQPIEETSTTPATTAINNKTVKAKQPRKLIQNNKITNYSDNWVHETASFLITEKKDFDKIERPANSTAHSRLAEVMLSFNPDENVHIAGPPDPPPDSSELEKHQPEKVAQEKVPAKSQSSENPTSANETKNTKTEITSDMAASDLTIPKEQLSGAGEVAARR